MVGLTSVGAGQLSTEMGGKVEEMSTDVWRYGEVGACLYFMMVSIFQLNRKQNHQQRLRMAEVVSSGRVKSKCPSGSERVREG